MNKKTNKYLHIFVNEDVIVGQDLRIVGIEEPFDVAAIVLDTIFEQLLRKVVLDEPLIQQHME